MGSPWVLAAFLAPLGVLIVVCVINALRSK
jgi:hypothetical protein